MLTRLLTSTAMPYIAAALLISAAFSGWKVRDWQCDAATAKALEHAEKNRAAMQETIDAFSVDYEKERSTFAEATTHSTNTVREIYRTLPPAPTSCAPDPRVVRLLEDGIDRANAAAASKPGE